MRLEPIVSLPPSSLAMASFQRYCDHVYAFSGRDHPQWRVAARPPLPWVSESQPLEAVFEDVYDLIVPPGIGLAIYQTPDGRRIGLRILDAE